MSTGLAFATFGFNLFVGGTWDSLSLSASSGRFCPVTAASLISAERPVEDWFGALTGTIWPAADTFLFGMRNCSVFFSAPLLAVCDGSAQLPVVCDGSSLCVASWG